MILVTYLGPNNVIKNDQRDLRKFLGISSVKTLTEGAWNQGRQFDVSMIDMNKGP